MVLQNRTCLGLTLRSSWTEVSLDNDELPCTSGFVGDSKVVVMRDTGCSSVIVKRDLVSDSKITGNQAYVRAFDGTVRKYPMVKVDVDTPYFVGKVEAICVPEPVMISLLVMCQVLGILIILILSGFGVML